MSDEKSDFDRMRKILFRAGIVAASLSTIAAIIDWTVPFPLVAHSDGGVSISPWDDRVFFLGLALCVATIALAAFGRGVWRWLLIFAGVVLFVFSAMGFVGNHV
jgi:Mn2+/Fe2+ NRAMP family transporter